ncbi:virulence RhuM family protein [Janthinobacterium sp. PAMC25594]|uniref:virulence RhuM family protein n=1 Tax=Janthinobacterium sp. PAMC25594 TaxID=2861284 RepID=UPI001C63A464|nr:virulence RhuM family protein [Janthinobacterium sp. PAMC25594]QYG04995.1 virulence RhuM family protein [Janthinobacterium sp. PAMC25594]
MDNDVENTSQFLFYAASDGNVKVQVILGDETVWTTLKGMAEIFGVEENTIGYHVKNVYESNELAEIRTTRKIRVVRQEGTRQVNRELDFYNLDMIISVGYRVNSVQATTFRIWATAVLKEYLVKGFALNDDRLKQGSKLFGKDYFDELLERIREIRASERRFYQKITDLYAQCSIDYDKHAQITQVFYATVQNKFHFAIHGHTASELVKLRSDADKPNMGLTAWKNEKTGGKILKTDISVAKNYLSESELRNMNRLVSQYLDFAEGMAERQKAMTMEAWTKKLDDFLKFNEYEVLDGAGHVSADAAKKLAEAEFAKFRTIQDKEFTSDFDKVVNEIMIEGQIPPPKN